MSGSIFRSVPILAALLLSMGCSTRPPDVDVGGRIARAARLEGAIAFARYGEPLDVTDAAPTQLTRDAALELALRHDPELQASLARVRAALADADQARLLPNPVLSVALRFPEGGGTPTLEAGLAADLLSLLGQPRRISAADHRLRAAAAEALTVALDRTLELCERYAAAQAHDAQLRGLGEQRRLIQRLLDLAAARLEAGEGSRPEWLSVDALRVRLEVEMLDVEARRRDQRLALARLIGRPSGAADWMLPPWRAPAALPPDQGRWIAAALANRPEVQVCRWELAALGDEAALARWTVLEGTQVGADAEREDGWGVGPAVSAALPLWDWGQARRENLDARRSELRHQLVRAQRQAVEDVRRALAALAGAHQTLAKVGDELIPLLERRLEQAQGAYEAGLSGVGDVLLIEQDLQQARGRLIELQRQVSDAQSRLYRAVGGRGVAAAVPTTAPTTSNQEQP